MKVSKSKIAANHAKLLEPRKYLWNIVNYFEITDSAITMPQQSLSYFVWVLTKYDEKSEKLIFRGPSRDILVMSTVANAKRNIAFADHLALCGLYIVFFRI